jgi:FixJ family two-component response regulator
MRAPPTVFAIDDDEAILDSLKYIVNGLGFSYQPYSTAEAFWKGRDIEKTGCLILDMAIPDQSGEELFDQLKATGRPWPTIAITGHGEFALGVRMVKKGVLDFLEKPFAAENLKVLIKQAVELDFQQRARQGNTASLREAVASLSASQRAVLNEIRSGASNREIAERLDISLRTVQLRRSQIAKNLGVEGRSAWTKLIFALAELDI